MSEVLILGGGFAGVEAAISLAKRGFKVSLIANRDYFFIYPISIWIPVRKIEFKDASISLAELGSIYGFELIIDEVVKIDVREKIVKCKGAKYGFEYLIVALGSGKVKHKGIEHTFSICAEPSETLKIKDRLDNLIGKGCGKIAVGFGGNPKDPSNVRGGPAFEIIFNIHSRLKKLGIRDRFELTFFAPMQRPGARLGKQALKMIDLYFERQSINRRFGKKIEYFEQDGIVFEDGSKLESDLTIFIPAGDGHAVFKNSNLPLNESGFIKINDYCEVVHDYDKTPDSCNIFAIGDSAAIDGPDWRAKQGHIAEVMARCAAFNIDAISKGSDKRRGYVEHINILCIMDSGDAAALVFRNNKGGRMLPMPVVGHWIKKGWGWYFKNSKLKKIPRLPGL